jgi:regulator of protease activity HflC (stomatin/prohibitin superfamily)
VQESRGRMSPIALFIFLLMMVISSILIVLGALSGWPDWAMIAASVAPNLIGVYILIGLKMADQWDKAVVLRNGNYRGLFGPGLFWIIPVIDRVVAWIDHRVMVTSFNAEKTLTKDTVPVDVDAVLFWIVWDAEKAALEVEDYQSAISWAAQTALREIIGRMTLADILVGREKMDEELQRVIDTRTTPWGVTVQSVEIRDVVIPAGLEDAMSRQAQAERERQARVILGESEEQISESFRRASKAYEHNPTALHLRAMNMLFEGLKARGAMVIVPSTAIDTMNLGGIMGITSLAGTPPVGDDAPAE